MAAATAHAPAASAAKPPLDHHDPGLDEHHLREHHDHDGRRGNAADLERNGSYAFTSTAVADTATPGFGAATIYYPTTAGTFGGVAISPGFTESQSAISWPGSRLVSARLRRDHLQHAAPVYYNPASWGTQLLAALDYLTGSSAVRDRVDASRLAVMGHSMGGGGAIEAGTRDAR